MPRLLQAVTPYGANPPKMMVHGTNQHLLPRKRRKIGVTYPLAQLVLIVGMRQRTSLNLDARQAVMTETDKTETSTEEVESGNKSLINGTTMKYDPSPQYGITHYGDRSEFIMSPTKLMSKPHESTRLLGKPRGHATSEPLLPIEMTFPICNVMKLLDGNGVDTFQTHDQTTTIILMKIISRTRINSGQNAVGSPM